MENMTKKFADAVLTRRKQLGLTQEELAARVGTSKQMVCKYEKGQRSPKVAMANAFAEALETTLDELLEVEKVEEYRLRGWQDVSFRPHDLRHTFVTVGRDKGVDLKVMISWCGHASEKMVLEIYDHPSEKREQDALLLMEG